MNSSVKVNDSGKTVCPNNVRWCEFSFPSLPFIDLKSMVGTPFAYSGKINGEVICLFSITSILSTYFVIFSPGMMFLAFTSVQISIVGCVCKMTASSLLYVPSSSCCVYRSMICICRTLLLSNCRWLSFQSEPEEQLLYLGDYTTPFHFHPGRASLVFGFCLWAFEELFGIEYEKN